MKNNKMIIYLKEVFGFDILDIYFNKEIYPDLFMDISVNYELPYSENFRTFVFTFQDGEMELKTFMVTFDKKFNKIDNCAIIISRNITV